MISAESKITPTLSIPSSAIISINPSLQQEWRKIISRQTIDLCDFHVLICMLKAFKNTHLQLFIWIVSFLAWPLMWLKELDYLSWCHYAPNKQTTLAVFTLTHTKNASTNLCAQILTHINKVYTYSFSTTVIHVCNIVLLLKHVYHHHPVLWQWLHQVTLSCDCQA